MCEYTPNIHFYNYQEFIKIAQAAKIPYIQQDLEKNVQLYNSTQAETDLFLLTDGFVGAYSRDCDYFLMTILGKGSLANYFTLLDNQPNRFSMKTLSDCSIIRFKKADVEYLLSMFPENYGFHFYITKQLSTHTYLKSLVLALPSNERVKRGVTALGQLLGEPVEKDGKQMVCLSRHIKTSVIMEYCNLSKATFFRLFKELKDSGYLTKDGDWYIHDPQLYQECHFKTTK
ncbi:Crp/Fnr family transcriptional regulator [Listeria costaricensis]|uniref:Crp/Fnr family transcriptional regulator n=1 Tax=Listeria costaricensis TaxID=2026604 RepID=UPI000C07D69A|nr:Crp/Fnr family transcriptional regulator [Listeria costaricensis]